MMRTGTLLKAASAALALGLAGVAGATYAGSQDPGQQPDEHGAIVGEPAAVNTALLPEQKFVPVNACRLVDTRQTAAGRIPAGGFRAFDVFGTSSFANQGGSADGCGIPSHAAGVSVNLISVSPTGAGYLRGRNQNSTLLPNAGAPSATLLSFATGPNRSNEVPLTTCRPFGIFGCSGGDEIRIWAFQKSTHVVIDVLGYYVDPVLAVVEGDAVDPADTAFRRAVGFGAVTRPGNGQYTLTTTRDLRGCAILANVSSSDDADSGTNGFTAHVDTVDPGELTVRVTNAAGTLTNEDFVVSATC